MTYAETIKLLDAGYSREEILKMREQGMDAGSSNSDPSGENLDSGSAVNDAVVEALQGVKLAVEDFKKEITAMNIMNSSMPAPEDSKPEDIIANIINPFNRDKKED